MLCSDGTWFTCGAPVWCRDASGASSYRCQRTGATTYGFAARGPRDGVYPKQRRVYAAVDYASWPPNGGTPTDFDLYGCCQASTDCVDWNGDCVADLSEQGVYLCDAGAWFMCGEDSLGATRRGLICAHAITGWEPE